MKDLMEVVYCMYQYTVKDYENKDFLFSSVSQ